MAHRVNSAQEVRLSMLNFLGIGAQKCGTSWLHAALEKHPKISFPGGKEIHYWNRTGGRTLDWYGSLFANQDCINGEITPAYAMLPSSTILQIYSTFPNLRLIYLIRNPIERAWSSARMALGLSEMAHEEASDQWFIDHFNSAGSLHRGDYETCIRRWKSVFNQNQLLIIRYETVICDPIGALNKCLSHLGLGCFYKERDLEEFSKPVFAGDGMPVRSSLRHELSKLYATRISSLSQYLEEDFSNWS